MRFDAVDENPTGGAGGFRWTGPLVMTMLTSRTPSVAPTEICISRYIDAMRLPLVSLLTCLFAVAHRAFAGETTAIVPAAPQALAATAVTSDWPCLLGPTHNEVSPET